jgi:hypothetical protein
VKYVEAQKHFASLLPPVSNVFIGEPLVAWPLTEEKLAAIDDAENEMRAAEDKLR